MTFVVVHLVDAKRVVVVPENWIQDLNNAKLKNIGKSSNQKYFGQVQITSQTYKKKPDFCARLVKQYFPTHIGVCYICRVKNFFGKCSIRIHLQFTLYK